VEQKTYDSYWTLPGIAGTRPGLPEEQIAGQPIPTTWAMAGPTKAREMGAVLHKRERLPRFYSVPEGVDPWVSEEQDGICVHNLDLAKLVHDEEREKEVLSAEVRQKRDALLALCDWTQVTDAPLEGATQSLWADYRQLLRDVPDQDGFPDHITWPEMLG